MTGGATAEKLVIWRKRQTVSVEVRPTNHESHPMAYLSADKSLTYIEVRVLDRPLVGCYSLRVNL